MIQDIDEITACKENKDNERVDVSNEINNSKNDNIINHIGNNDNNISGNDQEVNLITEGTISEEVNECTNKSINNSNDHNICFNKNSILNDFSNVLNFSNSSSELNKSISSDQLIIVENSDHEDNEIVLSSKTICTNDSAKTNESNDKESKAKMHASEAKNGLQLLPVVNNLEQNTSKTEIENAIETVEIDTDSNKNKVQDKVLIDNNDDYEIIESDSNSDISDDNESFDEKLVNNIFNDVINLNNKNFTHFIKLFDKSNLEFEVRKY